MDINNATILITGAAQGIGRQLAIYFSSRAYEVIIASRNKQKLDETAKLIENKGGYVTPLMLDLCDPESIEALISSIRLSGKRIDILINNAANTTSKPLIDTSIEEIDQIVRTNVIGCLQLCRLVAPIMIEQGQGMIINISSLAGYNPIGSQTVYGSSKAAVNALSIALLDELYPHGIHVMNIAQEGLAIDSVNPSHKNSFNKFAHILEAAIKNNESELFLSPSKKFLMRLYKFIPEITTFKKRLKFSQNFAILKK